MNYRNILKVYRLERELTDNETAFLNTLRAMNESERELLVESLQPQKPAKKPSKRAGKKSARASGMEAQLSSRRQERRATESEYCAAQINDNGGLMECRKQPDDNVHHIKTFPDYHDFVVRVEPESIVV